MLKDILQVGPLQGGRIKGRAGAAGSLKVGGVTKDIYEAGLVEGVIVRPLSSCFVMAPPLIITEVEITELGRRLWAALDRVLSNRPNP